MPLRHYATGCFQLVLDKESAKVGEFTESGGLMTTQWTGTTLKALNKQLAAAINFGLVPRSVQILSVAYDGKVVQIRDISTARFTKFVFNSVGAALNMPSTLDVTVIGTSKTSPGDGTIVPVAGVSISMQQPWVRCDYRLELGPLPTQKVSAIGAIAIDAPNRTQNFVISVLPVDSHFYRDAMAEEDADEGYRQVPDACLRYPVQLDVSPGALDTGVPDEGPRTGAVRDCARPCHVQLRDLSLLSCSYTKTMHTGAGESSVTSVFVSSPVGRSILNRTVTPLFCPSAKT